MPDSQPTPDTAQPTPTQPRRKRATRPQDWRDLLRTVLRGVLRTSAVLAVAGITLLYAVHFTASTHGGGFDPDVLQAATLYAALVAVAGLVDVVLASHFAEAVDRVAVDRAAEMAEVRADIAAMRSDIQEMRDLSPSHDGEALDRLAERIGELAEEAGERSDGEFLRGVQATVDGMRGDAGSVSTLNQRAPRQRMPGRVGGPGAPVVHP